MEIELREIVPIEVEVEGIKFIFRPFTNQDVVYATAIIQSGGSSLDVIDRDTTFKHVFNALQGIEGEIKVSGTEEVLTVEKLKELAQQGKLQGAFSRLVVGPWAVKTLEAHGFFKMEPTEETKKAPKKKESAGS